MQAAGAFEVDLQPLPSFAQGVEGNTLARLSIEKTFHGDLDAKSLGEMLSVRTAEEGSAGYVAIEQVTGSLQGKHGTFVLQHFGMMNRGESRLVLEVVPGSGTGQLVGLSGSMALKIEDGRHDYVLDYTLG